MSDQQTTTSPPDSYQWHPDYKGQSFESVQRELADSIRRDQVSYEAALESAEKEEHGAFTTVRDLEKRWSDYDFAWFEQDPDLLARKISRFEQERESRQEMISWKDWKNEGLAPAPAPAPTATRAPGEKGDWRENLSDEQRRKLASALSILVLVTIALLCVSLYLLVR